MICSTVLAAVTVTPICLPGHAGRSGARLAMFAAVDGNQIYSPVRGAASMHARREGIVD